MMNSSSSWDPQFNLKKQDMKSNKQDSDEKIIKITKDFKVMLT